MYLVLVLFSFLSDFYKIIYDLRSNKKIVTRKNIKQMFK